MKKLLHLDEDVVSRAVAGGLACIYMQSTHVAWHARLATARAACPRALIRALRVQLHIRTSSRAFLAGMQQPWAV